MIRMTGVPRSDFTVYASTEERVAKIGPKDAAAGPG